MKTFRQFTIDDKLYYCNRNAIEYKIGKPIEIKDSHLDCSFMDARRVYHFKINGDNLHKARAISKYNDGKSSADIFVFALESEAIRYCKTNLLKELRNKISKAKGYIQDVIKFRLDNIDHLNKDWVESEILKLEKMEREIL